MPRTRKNDPPSLKARVGVEAIKAHKTTAQIGQMFAVHPAQAGAGRSRLWPDCRTSSATAASRCDGREADAGKDDLVTQTGQLNPRLSVQQQCELLGVSRPTYYYQPRPESAGNLRLLRRLDELPVLRQPAIQSTGALPTDVQGGGGISSALDAQGHRQPRDPDGEAGVHVRAVRQRRAPAVLPSHLEGIGCGHRGADRHASLSKKAGVDPKVASGQRGHGLGVSMEVYTSSDMEQKRAALKKLEAAVLRKPQPQQPSELAKSA